MTTSNDVILKRIELMEEELAALKRQVTTSSTGKSRRSVRGLWKGHGVSDEEIEAAKQIWTKGSNDQPI